MSDAIMCHPCVELGLPTGQPSIILCPGADCLALICNLVLSTHARLHQEVTESIALGLTQGISPYMPYTTYMGIYYLCDIVALRTSLVVPRQWKKQPGTHCLHWMCVIICCILCKMNCACFQTCAYSRALIYYIIEATALRTGEAKDTLWTLHCLWTFITPSSPTLLQWVGCLSLLPENS